MKPGARLRRVSRTFVEYPDRYYDEHRAIMAGRIYQDGVLPFYRMVGRAAVEGVAIGGAVSLITGRPEYALFGGVASPVIRVGQSIVYGCRKGV